MPHFALGNLADTVEVSALTDELRKQIELKGLDFINKNLDGMIESMKKAKDGTVMLNAKDLSNLMKAMTHSQDSRKTIEIKKAELESKKKQYDRMFNKALYADDEPANIQDAEVEEIKKLN